MSIKYLVGKRPRLQAFCTIAWLQNGVWLVYWGLYDGSRVAASAVSLRKHGRRSTESCKEDLEGCIVKLVLSLETLRW